MKYVVFLICVTCFVSAETQTGSIVVFISSPDVLTIAADSRAFEPVSQTRTDTSCKISAFGNKFVFAVVGSKGHTKDAMGEGWNADEIARSIWDSERKKHIDAKKLVDAVAEKWAMRMEGYLRNPALIKTMRPMLERENNLESAVFLATDETGELVIKETDFFIDLALFDNSQAVQIWHTTVEKPIAGGGAIGFNQVVAEFQGQSSKRAQEYMNWYLPKISSLKSTIKDATLAEKLVELTILLHPKQEYLGFPIDELQLTRGIGVRWLHKKANCASQ